MIDLQTKLRNALDRSVSTQLGGATPPPIEPIRQAVRDRRRRMKAVLRTAIAVAVVSGAFVAYRVRDSDSQRPAARIVTVGSTPLTSRLYPSDTDQAVLQSVFIERPVAVGPGLTRPQIATQVWTRDGVPVLAIRTDNLGTPAPTEGVEVVVVPGWSDAELETGENGLLTLRLADGSASITRVVTRELSRDRLVELASSLTPRARAFGVDLAVGAEPAGTVKDADEAGYVESKITFFFVGKALIHLNLQPQTAAGREFDRLIAMPTSSTIVGAEPAAVFDEGDSTTVAWMPTPSVEASVEVIEPPGSFADALGLAVRVASSVRSVDDATWQGLIARSVSSSASSAPPVASTRPTFAGASDASDWIGPHIDVIDGLIAASDFAGSGFHIDRLDPALSTSDEIVGASAVVTLTEPLNGELTLPSFRSAADADGVKVMIGFDSYYEVRNLTVLTYFIDLESGTIRAISPGNLFDFDGSVGGEVTPRGNGPEHRLDGTDGPIPPRSEGD